MKTSIVLKTKLTPHRVKSQMLKRSALTKKLKRLNDHPLTLVHSGPGYGKSTAVASFIREMSAPYCWYSISEHDDDLYVFLTYIVHAIRGRFPAFGEELLNHLAQGEYYVRDSEFHRLFDAFLNELGMIPEELTLVLDDYHLIQHCDGVDAFMQYTLKHIPAGIHVVLLSRNRPNWEPLAAMKVRGDLLEITEQDLAFSEEEIEVLFTDYYDYPLRPEEAQLIYLRTEGWAIAVQLIWQRLLLTGSDVQTLVADEAETMDDLFRFLALEVFQKQTPDIGLFMLQTSLLEELTADACNRILERDDSYQLLAKLCSQSLFLAHLGEGLFRYHSLFRDFLQGQFKKMHKEYVRFAHLAAAYLAATGQYGQAMNLFAAAGDAGEAARMLEIHGRTLMETGQLEALMDRIRRTPLVEKNARFMLWIYEGDVHRYRCVYEQALSCYTQAEQLAAAASDRLGQSLALEGQVRVYLDTIQPGRAQKLLERSIDLLESSVHPEDTHRVRLYGLMAENLVNSGRAAEAEDWFNKCRLFLTDFHEDWLEARLHLRSGRLRQAKRLAERIVQQRSSASASQLPRSHREIELLLSLIASMQGQPETAKQLAEAGMMIGIRLHAPFVEAVGWMRMGHAAQLLQKYDPTVAVKCYRAAQEMMEQLDVSRGKAEPLMGLALLYGREGAFELAAQFGEEALAETEKVNDEWLSSYIRISRGIAAYYTSRWEEAAAVFLDCHNRFMLCGDSYGLTVTLLWQAMLAYRTEQDDRFHDVMERFLQMLQYGDYDALIERRTLFGPRDVQHLAPLLIEAQKQKIESGYVTHLLTGMGMEHMTYHPGYTLHIETLGGFRVRLGDRELEEKDWQRGKAKELFQLLVVKRQQLLPKEAILALLYPQSDDKSAARDFKVMLNALNTALEPHRRARSNPFFIQRHGSSYGLNLASGFELDTIEFEALLKAGLEDSDPAIALALLEKGLELYKGDYMPDRRYEDWCIEERERLLVLYLRGAERLARLQVKAQSYDRAIHWCEAIVHKDSCWEEAYRLLMQCHLKLGNRRQAARWYQKCQHALAEEMGVEPMPATQELYKQLSESDVTDL